MRLHSILRRIKAQSPAFNGGDRFGVQSVKLSEQPGLLIGCHTHTMVLGCDVYFPTDYAVHLVREDLHEFHPHCECQARILNQELANVAE